MPEEGESRRVVAIKEGARTNNDGRSHLVPGVPPGGGDEPADRTTTARTCKAEPQERVFHQLPYIYK